MSEALTREQVVLTLKAANMWVQSEKMVQDLNDLANHDAALRAQLAGCEQELGRHTMMFLRFLSDPLALAFWTVGWFCIGGLFGWYAKP